MHLFSIWYIFRVSNKKRCFYCDIAFHYHFGVYVNALLCERFLQPLRYICGILALHFVIQLFLRISIFSVSQSITCDSAFEIITADFAIMLHLSASVPRGNLFRCVPSYLLFLIGVFITVSIWLSACACLLFSHNGSICIALSSCFLFSCY